MAKVHAPLLSFNRGEVSRLALARVDVESMRLAAESQVNWVPHVLGPMMLRPGTKYLGSTRSDAAEKCIPFVFSNSDTAILEFTASHMRVWKSDALITRASVSTSVTNGSFAASGGWTLSAGSGTANINSTVSGALYLAAGSGSDFASCLRSVSVSGGDSATRHAVTIVVTRGPVVFYIGTTSGGAEVLAKTTLKTGTHSLTFTPGATTIYVKFESALRYGIVVDSIAVESSGNMDVSAPWLAVDLPKLRWDQSGDIVYVACDGYQQREIERRDNDSWSVCLYQAEDGPFDTQNVDSSKTVLATASVGSVTLTGVNTPFTSSDVGRIIRLPESNASLIAEWAISETITVPTAAVSAAGTKIGDFTNAANAFDGNTGTSATLATSSGYIGTNQGTASGVLNARVRGTATYATNGAFDIYQLNIKLYAKTGVAPTTATDGTLLGSITQSYSGYLASPQAFDLTVTSGDTTSTWDYQWVQITATTILTTVVTALAVTEIDRLKYNAAASTAMRRYQGNVYLSLSGGTTGTTPPTHLTGDVQSSSGGVVWRYVHGEFGIARILAYTSATSVTADVLRTLPYSITQQPGTDWALGEWNTDDGWPMAVRFHDGRLWWARGDKIWGSVSDDFDNFDATTEGDSGPIARSIGVGPIATVNWLLSLTRMIVGCDDSEISIRSSAFDEPLTPTNFTLKACSTQGSYSLPALKIDTRGVFVEKSNRRVYELAYNVQIQDYQARDLTHVNPDIGIATFVTSAVQRQPDTVLHLVRADGEVACHTQSFEDQVEAWWRVNTLGVIEDVVILPGTQEDAVYYVVKRTINSSTKRFLEKFALRTQCQGGSLSRNLDCHLVVSQASSATISGLSHLEGETVYVWANGKDLGSYTVSSAAITASEAVTSAIVGLGGVTFSYSSATAATSVTCATKYNGYPAELYADGKYIGSVTVASGIAALPNGKSAKKITAYLGLYGVFRSAKLAYGAQMGTALGQHKKIGSVGIIALDMHYQGLKYGSDIHNIQPLPLVDGGQDTAADTVWSEFDRPLIGLPGSWDTDSRLHLLAQAPKPATVAAAIVAVSTNEAR